MNKEISENFEIIEEEESKNIDRWSSGWTKYILDQLENDERQDNYPKTCGILRLLEKEVSKIINIESFPIQVASQENGMCSSIKVKIYLENGETYEQIADVRRDDIDPPFSYHPSAIAETRALGRACRLALRLKNVVSAEEIVGQTTQKEDKINDTQITLINNLSSNSRLNINVKKLLSNMFGETAKQNIREYSHEDGVKISQELNNYQNKEIPKELLGFDINWKN